MRAAEEVNGLATLLRSVRISLYRDAARSLSKSSCAVAANWDGSCHGGLSVNLGLFLDTATCDACYLQPAVGGTTEKSQGQEGSINTKSATDLPATQCRRPTDRLTLAFLRLGPLLVF